MTIRASWLRCDRCGHELDEGTSRQDCPACHGLLAVRHEAPRSTHAALRKELESNRSPSGVWRFGELVLPAATNDPVSYPEGNTPLLSRSALCEWTGIEQLEIKHEGHNPTGSFKDRGMTVAITQARRIGARAVACASTGNTSASLAAYAAQAGLRALALVPDGQVARGKLAQTLAYGATTLIVDGDFDTCLRLLRAAGESLGVYLVNSINPFRLEGQKTIVFELLLQRNWQPPDWIVLPAGNLGNTAAFGKALDEALEWRLIDRKPRLAAVQAAGAAPFAAAFHRQFDRLEAVTPTTVASAIRIGAPASYHRAVRAIRTTNGVVLSVTDADILAAKVAVDTAGVGCEPASAASVAGAMRLRREGVIGPRDSVVVILTGHMLKDPGILEQLHATESIAPALANPPKRVAATIDAIQAALKR